MTKPHPHALKAHRNDAVWEMRTAGATLAACGRHFGITRERVRQIFDREQRLRFPLPAPDEATLRILDEALGR